MKLKYEETDSHLTDLLALLIEARKKAVYVSAYWPNWSAEDKKKLAALWDSLQAEMPTGD